MSVVAITASRTSPGATALATGLALAWSHRVEQSLLIEADPAGGVLALRFELAAAPSLTTLGSDVRNSYSHELLWSNTQDLRGVRCIPAPVDPRLARSWIERLVPTLVPELPRLGAPAVIDLGWVDEGGVSAPLAAAADTTLVVTSPAIAEVQSLLFQVRRLEALGANVALVTVGNTPNDPQEIAAIAGIPLAAVLPDDPRVAAALAGDTFTPKKFRRSLLWRTMCGLADTLLDETAMLTRASETSPLATAPIVVADQSQPAAVQHTEVQPAEVPDLATAAVPAMPSMPAAPEPSAPPAPMVTVAVNEAPPAAALPAPPAPPTTFAQATTPSTESLPAPPAPPAPAQSIEAPSTPHVPTIEVAMRRKSATPSTPEEQAFWAREGVNEQQMPLAPSSKPAWSPGPLEDLAPEVLDDHHEFTPQSPPVCIESVTVPPVATPSPMEPPAMEPVAAEPVATGDVPAIVISRPGRPAVDPSVAPVYSSQALPAPPPPPAAPAPTADTDFAEATLQSVFDPAPAAQTQPVFVLFDDGTRQELSMTTPMNIGRHHSCEIMLDDSQVSRQHGRITYTSGGWQFVDLGSRNGSAVNGNPCLDTFLTPGDELTIGRARLTFAQTSTREMECA